jgi:hypothetical protein
MEDQDNVLRSEATGRNNQGTVGDTSNDLRQEQVSNLLQGGSGVGMSHRSDPMDLMLDPNTDYVVMGECLNAAYLYAVEHFNNEANTIHHELNFSVGFWNGYGAAIVAVMAIVRSRTIDTEML